MRTPALLLATLTILGCSGSAPETDARTPASQPVESSRLAPRIVALDWRVQESYPPTLVLEATAEVPTGGYTNARLVRRTDGPPPVDGIHEFEFRIDPPDGPAIQVLTEHTATARWEGFDPTVVRGVRVFGEGDGIRVLRFD